LATEITMHRVPELMRQRERVRRVVIMDQVVPISA
jgi:hypothetical protein